MSIVLYHARVDESTLDALQANPDLFWELPEDADPTGAQLLYTDKDWRVALLALVGKGKRGAEARRCRACAQLQQG